MRFFEIDLFGVYAAPISVMIVAAWVVTIGLRRATAHFAPLNHVWHPALFVFCIFAMVLSGMILVIGD